jgi:hypothetical protein
MLKQFLSKKFIVVLAANVLLAILAVQVLGNAAGWLATTTRASAGVALGDGIPFLQFLAFATLLEQVMWTLSRRSDDQRLQHGFRGWRCISRTFVIYVVLFSTGDQSGVRQIHGGRYSERRGSLAWSWLCLRGLVSDIFSGIALQIDASLTAR